MKPKVDYTLYLVTDSGLCSWEDMPKAVEKSIKGGVTLVQIREKDIDTKTFYETALKIKEITDKYNVPLIINDRIDVAMAIDAAGVHIGQSDMPCSAARKLLGDDKIIGVSAGDIHEALAAQSDGADYIGFGAVYYTETKAIDAEKGVKALFDVKKQLSIPVVAIGGINKSNASNLKGGADGIAVVSAIMGQPDEDKASRELLEAFKGL